MLVPAPQLRMKLDLLHSLLHNDVSIAAAMHSDREPHKKAQAAALARMHQREVMPERYVGSFLRLFGLRPPKAPLSRQDPQHRLWFELLDEPDPVAFMAKVRLMGGDLARAERPGAVWQRFMQRHQTQADALGMRTVHVQRLDKPRRQAPGADRLIPAEVRDIAPRRTEPGPVLHLGERIAWRIHAWDALPQPSALGQRQAFAFYTVMVEGRQFHVPLLPAAPNCSLSMPEAFTRESTLEIPSDPTRANAFTVNADWDDQSLIVVLTRHRLEDDILAAWQDGGSLQAERLDLLATRLTHGADFAPGSWALMRLHCRVSDAPLPQADPRAAMHPGADVGLGAS